MKQNCIKDNEVHIFNGELIRDRNGNPSYDNDYG